MTHTLASLTQLAENGGSVEELREALKVAVKAISTDQHKHCMPISWSECDTYASCADCRLAAAQRSESE
jgi:hypothetical protein